MQEFNAKIMPYHVFSFEFKEGLDMVCGLEVYLWFCSPVAEGERLNGTVPLCYVIKQEFSNYETKAL